MSHVTEEEFQAALDTTPDDWAMRLVYADWLEERGECAKANGQRWMVENLKCPESGPLSRTSFADHWRWWAWAYETRTAAENALAESLDRLGIFVGPYKDEPTSRK